MKKGDKVSALSSLKDQPKFAYFIFFILVPLILFVIYLFPENIRNIFILYPSNPTIISIFLSNYTHTGFTHLSGNVFKYFVVGFLIFMFETGRKRFYINMLLLFTVLPVLCSLLTLYYLPNSASWGFSGIVAGWLGYLLYAVYGYIKEEWRIALNANFVFLMVMINLLILLSIYKWLGWLYGLLLSLLLILIVLIRNDLRAMVRKLINILTDFGMESRKSWKSFGFIFVKSAIFVLTINFLLFGFFDLFPPQIKINGSIVNILVHYSGYCFGVFVPLVIIDTLLVKPTMNKDEKIVEENNIEIEKHNKNIYNFWKYLSLTTLTVIMLFLAAIILILRNYSDYIVAFFRYFEKAELLTRFIMSKLTTSFELNEVIAIVIGLFVYFYFFEYIKKKGVMVFAEEEKESKYFGFLLSFFGIFNFVVAIPLILYLFIIKRVVPESLIILASFFISIFVFVPLMETCKRIVHNYNLLSALNLSSVSHEFKSMEEKMKNDFKGMLLKSINLKTLLQRVLEHVNVKAFMSGVIWYILLNISHILKAIFTLTFLVAFLGLIWRFNILSIIYIELTLVVWYFIVSAISYLPKKVVNIRLNTGEILKEVYIIEDSPKGHILALTQENKVITIMKNSIMIME